MPSPTLTTMTEAHLEVIARRRWKEVLSWIAFHPHQVCSLRDHSGQTILHHTILFRAPVDVIEAILWAAPELASVPNQDGEVALHWAVRLSSQNPILNVLLQTDPETAFVRDYMNATPLSMIWERHSLNLIETWRYTNRETFQNESNNSWKRVISIFQAVSRAKNPRNPDIFFPLHTAASLCTPSSLFPFMIEVYRDQLSVEETDGSTPLAIACESPGPNRSFDVLTKIQYLLKGDPTQAKQEDSSSDDRLPLHIALDAGIFWNEGVENLIQAFPSSLSTRDPVCGLFPFALAATGQSTTPKNLSNDASFDNRLTTIYNILREDPSLLHLNRS
jgi:hypothetical protein